MATIKIPPVLRPSVGGEKEVQAAGDDVGAVLSQLAEQHPATQSQLFGADGSLNRYVNVYLNDEDVRVLDGLGTVGQGRRHARHPPGHGRRADRLSRSAAGIVAAVATMPGLRPLAFGEILDVGIKLCRRNWRVLVMCVVWLVLPTQILSVAADPLRRARRARPDRHADDRHGRGDPLLRRAGHQRARAGRGLPRRHGGLLQGDRRRLPRPRARGRALAPLRPAPRAAAAGALPRASACSSGSRSAAVVGDRRGSRHGGGRGDRRLRAPPGRVLPRRTPGRSSTAALLFERRRPDQGAAPLVRARARAAGGACSASCSSAWCW